MSKTMFDAAFLPNPAPLGFDVAAGYVHQVHGEAANIWTLDNWHAAAAVCRYLLPIATCWTPFGDGGADALAAITAWEAVAMTLAGKMPAAFALDMELRVATAPGATGYAEAWRAGIRSRGYQDIVYSSSSGGHALGTGPLWLGPPAQPGQAWGNGPVSIAQQQYLGNIDTNTAVDAVLFYDTHMIGHGHPNPTGKGTAVEIVAHPAGGYYVFSSTGHVYAYGAPYFGGITEPLNAPIVGAALTPDGKGYWMLGQDGGVFAFGSAKFLGAPTGTLV